MIMLLWLLTACRLFNRDKDTGSPDSTESIPTDTIDVSDWKKSFSKTDSVYTKVAPSESTHPEVWFKADGQSSSLGSTLYLGLFSPENGGVTQLAGEGKFIGYEWSSTESGQGIACNEVVWGQSKIDDHFEVGGLCLIKSDSNGESRFVPDMILVEFYGTTTDVTDENLFPIIQTLETTVYEVTNPDDCSILNDGICDVKDLDSFDFKRLQESPYKDKKAKQSSSLPPTNHPLPPLQSAS